VRRHEIDDSDIIEIVGICGFTNYAITIAEALKREG